MAGKNIITEQFPEDEPEHIEPVIDDATVDLAVDDEGETDPLLFVDGPEQATDVAKGALVEIMQKDPRQAADLILALLSAGGARPAPTTAEGVRANYIDKNGNPVDWENVPPGTEAYATTRNAFPDRMMWPEKKHYTREYQAATTEEWVTIINRDPSLTPVIWNGVRYDLPVGKKMKVPAGVGQIYDNAVEEQIAFQNCQTLYFPKELDIMQNNGRGGSLRLGAAGGFSWLETYHSVKSAGGVVPPEIDAQLRRRPSAEIPDTNARPGVLAS